MMDHTHRIKLKHNVCLEQRLQPFQQIVLYSIDLIFEYKGLLVFVEVKFRSGIGFGFAEEFVDYTKRRLIIKGADHYIHENDWHKDIRFDIVGVYQDKNGNINFRQFEDAFY